MNIFGAKNNSLIIKKINKDISSLFELNKTEKRNKTSKRIRENVLKLSEDARNDNNELLQPLHLYFNILSSDARYNIDKTVHNEEIENYTSFFLSNKKKVLNVFDKEHLQKVIMFLLLANTSMHDLRNYSLLLDEYIGIYSYSYKAMMFLRLLNTPCGKMDLEKYIKPLFDNMDTELSRFVHDDSKAAVLSDLLSISEYLDLENESEQVLHYNIQFNKQIICKCTNNIMKYFETLQKFGVQKEAVAEWTNSIDTLKLSNDMATRLKALMEKCNNGIKRKAISPKEPANTGYTYLYNRFIYEKSKKDVSKKELLGMAEQAADYYYEMSSKLTDTAQKYNCNIYYYTLKGFVRSLKYWTQFEQAIEYKYNTDDDNNICFFINDWSLVNASVSLPVILAAQNKGFVFVPSSDRMCRIKEYKNPFLNDIAGMFMDDHDARYEIDECLDENYIIDVKNKKIIARGHNVYQPLLEFIARYQFTYFFNYDNDAWVRYKVHNMIRRYTRLFSYIEDIYSWAVAEDKKVYFVSHAPHIQNAAAYRIFCEDVNDTDHFNYICVSSGYDNYFKNIGDAKTETTSALNLTKNVNSRNSFLGTKEGFDNYYKNNREMITDLRNDVRKYLSVNRGSVKPDSEKEAIIARIKEHKSAGGKVFLLNGKVIFDLAVKYTKGCVHDNMSEWITHAVDYAKRNPDVLLLIKPHPHEDRVDLTLTLNNDHELKSIIKTELGDNIIYLDKNLFKNEELTPFTDLGLVWNGTSSLEFAALGIPVLMGDEWGYLDYPIGFIKPSDLKEYEYYLQNPQLLSSEQLTDKAVMFLSYIGSPEVRIENRYSKTTTMNLNQFDSEINLDAVSDYFKNGDQELDLLFDRLM